MDLWNFWKWLRLFRIVKVYEEASVVYVWALRSDSTVGENCKRLWNSKLNNIDTIWSFFIDNKKKKIDKIIRQIYKNQTWIKIKFSLLVCTTNRDEISNNIFVSCRQNADKIYQKRKKKTISSVKV